MQLVREELRGTSLGMPVVNWPDTVTSVVTSTANLCCNSLFGFGVLLSLHSVVYDDSNTGTMVLGTWT